VALQWQQQYVGGAAASDVVLWRQLTQKLAAEAEMATAADILLSYSLLLLSLWAEFLPSFSRALQ
jgi:hypothetical protein